MRCHFTFNIYVFISTDGPTVIHQFPLLIEAIKVRFTAAYTQEEILRSSLNYPTWCLQLKNRSDIDLNQTLIEIPMSSGGAV